LGAELAFVPVAVPVLGKKAKRIRGKIGSRSRRIAFPDKVLKPFVELGPRHLAPDVPGDLLADL